MHNTIEQLIRRQSGDKSLIVKGSGVTIVASGRPLLPVPAPAVLGRATAPARPWGPAPAP